MALSLNGSGSVSGLAAGINGFGKVLQVVQAGSPGGLAGVNTTSTTSYATVIQNGLSITPSSVSSKIFVTITASFSNTIPSGIPQTAVSIFRGSSTGVCTIIANNNISGTYPISLTTLDSPATISPVTYNLALTCFHNGAAMSSSNIYITLMEIAA